MRVHGAIAAASIALLVISALGYHRALTRAGRSADPERAITAEKAHFLEGHTEDVRIDPSVRGQLLDPALALPSTHLHPYPEVAALYRYAKSCDSAELEEVQSESLEKAKLWHEHRCTGAPLSETFFSERPYMHPSGRSFVSLALEEEPARYRNAAWISEHLLFLHALELDRVSSSIALEGPDRILAQATAAELAAFHANAPIVLTRDHVFFFQRTAADEYAPSDGGVFRGFSLATWSKAESDALFRAVPAAPGLTGPWSGKALPSRADGDPNPSGTVCALREGNACWLKNDSVIDRAKVFGGLGVSALLGLASSIGFLFIGRLREKRREEEERMFALTTLAHELRTPSTAIGLSLETFRSHFDALPEDCQTELLRLFGEVERLNRVIAGSARYVKSRSGKPRERYTVTTIESITGFIEGVLEKHAEAVELEKPAVDGAFRTDPYWLSVSIENLVQNALVHGRPPVRVRVLFTPELLEIRVEDQGSIEGRTLEELLRPFSRGHTSKGLGLGLSIVSRTIRDLGGSLLLETRPTTFILKMRGDEG